MKTVREWLEELPEPYKGEALMQTDGDLSTKYVNLYDALSSAFYWEGSPQGDRYWRNISRGIFPVITNALSALHAIALKEGFPVEEIMSIRNVDGMWLYKLAADNRIEYSFNPENDKL
jgi:hypothetical protein